MRIETCQKRGELGERKLNLIQQNSKSKDPGGGLGHVLGMFEEQEPLRLKSGIGWRRQGSGQVYGSP